MYASSQCEEDTDYWYRKADKIAFTLCNMCENRTEYKRLRKVIDKLL